MLGSCFGLLSDLSKLFTGLTGGLSLNSWIICSNWAIFWSLLAFSSCKLFLSAFNAWISICKSLLSFLESVIFCCCRLIKVFFLVIVAFCWLFSVWSWLIKLSLSVISCCNNWLSCLADIRRMPTRFNCFFFFWLAWVCLLNSFDRLIVFFFFLLKGIWERLFFFFFLLKGHWERLFFDSCWLKFRHSCLNLLLILGFCQLLLGA